MLSWFSARFSRKLALAFCLTLVMTTLLTEFFLGRAFQSFVVQELSSSLLRQAGLVAAQTTPASFGGQPGALQDLVLRLGRIAAARATFIAPDGRVLADSDVSLDRIPTLENHRDRPEVASALGGRAATAVRRSPSLGGDLLYAAAPVTGAAGVSGVVRLALPLAEVRTKQARMRRIMFLVTLVMVVGAVALAVRLAASMSRSLSEISEVARRLAAGDLSARIRRPPSDEHRQLAETLNLMAETIQRDMEQLKKLEQVRKDFVANVSHELRTPLASIKAYAETLRSGALEDPDAAGEFVREIEESADRMTRLVDDLLALSALESGRFTPAAEPVSLMRLAGEVTASLKPLAERKGIVIRIEPFHGLPDVRADRGRLKQVFVNLLDNAIKYTGAKGTVRMSASHGEGLATVAIQDNGPGIPAEHLPRIFERFYRVDKARSRELGGTGLGLSIVKHIVEAHGGSVSVESVEGEGSTFRFSIPT